MVSYARRAPLAPVMPRVIFLFFPIGRLVTFVSQSGRKLMRKSLLLVFLLLFVGMVWGQTGGIRSMRWGKDYNLHVRMSNDSSYVMDVRGLYHQSGSTAPGGELAGTTYFPVSLDQEFVEFIKSQPIDASPTTEDSTKNAVPHYATLWSALHGAIGGGYVHLINCIIYALESDQVHLQNKMMKRPETNWKPKPMTETYKRTRKWEYYTPTNQREAHREYKLRKKEGALTDLQGIPTRFLELFLATSDGEYRRFVHEGHRDKVAQIDLVRMMLGAKYLGEAQIAYVSDGVRSAITRYSASNLPSVIIFDDYNAAVAMRLDSGGYRVDYIVFQDQNSLSPEEVQRREANIRALVGSINQANDMLFRRRLSQYYE